MRTRFALAAALLTLAMAAAAPAQAATNVYTPSDVAKHASRSSCWTIVGTGVYDITTFIGRHPGGPSAALALCGRNGTAMFRNQHGGAGGPASVLAGYRIGKLKAARTGSAGAAAASTSPATGGGRSNSSGTDDGDRHDDGEREDHGSADHDSDDD